MRGVETFDALMRESKAGETEYLSSPVDVCKGASASSSELSRSVMTMPGAVCSFSVSILASGDMVCTKTYGLSLAHMKRYCAYVLRIWW